MLTICPVCGTSFVKYNKKHTYHCRKCFKKAYDLREKLEKKKDDESFPLFRCPQCGQETQLTFSVKKDIAAWNKFRCPQCGYRNNMNF